MAIAPNTTFVSGAVLTAAQQNAFGFGIVSYVQSITPGSGFTTTAVQLTGTAFTAIANRYYKITYLEPSITNTTTADCIMSILNGATQLQATILNVNATYSSTAICQLITTFSAGSVTLTANLRSPTSGTGTAGRATGRAAFLLVEDIGPA